jgi:PAS domain S-box-containing protein
MQKDSLSVNNEMIAREKLLLMQTEELAKTGSWELNLITNTLYWSDGVFKLLEFEPNEFEVTFEKGVEVIHPDDRASAIETMQEAIKNKSTYQIQKRFITKNGNIKYIRSFGKFIFNEQNQPEKLVGVFQDISDEIYSKLHLQELNERLEMVFQAGYESVWDYNPVTHEMFLGEGFAENFGTSASKDLMDNNEYFNSLYHPDERDAVLSDFRHMAFKTTETKWLKEFRFRKLNGEYAYVRDRAIIKRNEKGQPIRVVGAIQDITAEFYYKELDKIEKNAMALSFNENITVEHLLSTYLTDFEKIFPNLKTSVVKIDEGKLLNIASPSMPQNYIDAVNGTLVGDESGIQFEKNIFKHTSVHTQNLTEARWANFTGLAQQFGLGSCWAQPILNSSGNIIANLLVYFNSEKGLSPLETQAITRTQRLLSVLLVKFEYLEHIQKNNERYQLINKATNDALYDWDVVNDIFYWGDSFYRIFGFEKSNKTFRLIDWAMLMHPYDAEVNQNSWEDFLNDKNQNSWKKEFRFKRADGAFVYVEEIGYLIRNENGRPIRMIGVLRDISASKVNELQQSVQQQIGLFFKSQATLQQQMQQVLNYLANYGTFQIAELWLLNYQKNLLQLASAFASNDQFVQFHTHSQHLQQLQIGEGIPGLVWKTGQWQVLDNITENKLFIRRESAKRVQLQSALAIPLFDVNEFIGVLMLASTNNIHLNDIKYKIYKPLGQFLGGEIKRRQQEEQLELFFDAATDYLAILAPNGYFIKLNEAFCTALGYSEHELTAKPFTAFVHPDDEQTTKQYFLQNPTAINHNNNFINRYRTSSGQYLSISWKTSLAYGEQGLLFVYGRDITEILQLEELLQTANQLAKLGAWEYDIRKQQLKWSEMTKIIHEVPINYEPNVNTALEFYRSDYRKIVNDTFYNAAQNAMSYDLEVPIITQKGNEKWVRIIGKCETHHGNCIRVFGSIQDINERVMMESRLKNIANNAPGVIYQYHLKPDGSDKLLFVSDGSYKIWHLSPQQCMDNIHLVWEGIKQGGDFELVQQSIIESATHLTPWHASFRYVLPDGTLHYHEGFGNPQKRADGSIVWDSIIMDITEKHNLQDLAKRTSRMAKIGSWELNLIDESNDSMYWSLITREIFEVPENYVPALTKGFEFFKGENRSKIEQSIQQLMQNAVDFDDEFLITTYAGKQKWVRCIGRSEWVQNKCVKIYGSIQDIHQQKTNELSLQQHIHDLAVSNRELEQFAYVASHDLQEPLRMITSFLSLLEQKYQHQLNEQGKQYIHFATDGAKRMRQLILDVLEFSKIGKTKTKKETINMNLLLQEVCAMQKNQIEESGAIIQIGELPQIYNYRSSLIQIFNNLINNAIKYRKPNVPPKIMINAATEKEGWLFTVADNGIGIESEYLDQIFVIFQRLHTQEHYSGTGIGLAIVKKIIDHLGGKIWVDSKPGIGSNFYVWLPELV